MAQNNGKHITAYNVKIYPSENLSKLSGNRVSLFH